MLPALLLLIGAGLSFFCLWQLRQWLAAAPQQGETGSARLESIVDELVATAEMTVQVIDEKAQALTVLIAKADEQAARLAQEVKAPVAQPVAAQVAEAPPEPLVPELHREVYRLSDQGQNVTDIARKLNITKGEVQLILGLRRTG